MSVLKFYDEKWIILEIIFGVCKGLIPRMAVEIEILGYSTIYFKMVNSLNITCAHLSISFKSMEDYYVA